MKHSLLLIVLLFASFGLYGQTLSVNKTDNSNENYQVSDVNKIMFDDTNMIVKFNDGTSANIPIATIRSLIIDKSTGLKKTIYSSVYVYPNPASTFIQFKNLDESYQTVQVLSLDGRVLLQKSICSTDNIVDIHSLRKGIYLIKINGAAVKLIKE